MAKCPKKRQKRWQPEYLHADSVDRRESDWIPARGADTRCKRFATKDEAWEYVRANRTERGAKSEWRVVGMW